MTKQSLNQPTRVYTPSVLVVDDSEPALYLIESILRPHNYQVHCLADSTKAMDQARSIKPDIILLDIMMPDMDGFEVCSQLKADPLLCEIPVIFLTALTDVKNMVHGFHTGGSDYLTKPVDPAELLARISTQINLHRTQQELAAKNKLLEEKIHDLEKTQRALKESEAQTAAVLNNAAVCIAVLDFDGGYIMVNDLCTEMFGYPRSTFTKMHCRDHLHADFIKAQKETMQNLRSGELQQTYRVNRFRRKDGSYFWGGHWMSRRLDPNGVCNGFVCVISDLTENKEREDELRMAHTVFETCSEGILVSDSENRIALVNPAFTDITGYQSEQALGQNPKILQSGRHDKKFYRQMWKKLLQQGQWQGEVWNRRQSGEIYPQWQSVSLVRASDGTISNYVSVFSDITERKKAEEILRRQALYDPLTKLPNRSLFDERLNTALIRARRRKTMVALFYIDLDDFKRINDTMGHLAGDRVLQLAATCLENCLRQEDAAGRFGGDEFVTVLGDIKERQEAVSVVERLLASLNSTLCPGTKQPLSASVGIALYPEHGDGAEVLIREADAAMYTAKQLGKGRYHFADMASPWLSVEE
ncbi:MAG: diguanylate cyclase [Thermodesulfobacteriota bacterium]